MLVERLAYRPLRHSSRLGPLLSALGVSIVLQNMVIIIYGPQPMTFPALIPPIAFKVAGANITLIQIVILASSALLMLALNRFVHRSRLGIQIRAVAENRRMALLIGIDIDKIIALIFFLGGALGAVAGMLYGAYYGVIQFSMGLLVGLKAFTAAILGGIGSITGAVLGAYLLAALEVWGSGVLPILTNDVVGSEYKDVFAFVVLIGVLVFRPAGLLGQTVSEETIVYKRDF
jgi:branched-chain amino acid transport system permease protein